MTDGINGTVITLSELVASSSETLYSLAYGLTFARDTAQPVPPAFGAGGLLHNLSPALVYIGRTIRGSSLPDVCPATAVARLDHAEGMIGWAATAIGKAVYVMPARGRQAPPSLEFPNTVTTRQARHPEGPVVSHDVNGAAIWLSELVASSAEALYRVQHGLNERGPGRPVADVSGAVDLLDQLSRAIVYIRGTIVGSSQPDVCPADAVPHLNQAADLLTDGFTAIRKAEKATRAGGPRTRHSRDFPAALAPPDPARAARSPRATGQRRQRISPPRMGGRTP
jgi:hypothetical protein